MPSGSAARRPTPAGDDGEEGGTSAWRHAPFAAKASAVLAVAFVTACMAAAAMAVTGAVGRGRHDQGAQTALLGERQQDDVRQEQQALLGVLTGGAHGTTEMLLQNDIGEPCQEHWNCMDWLVCADNLCSSCHSNHECQQRHPARQCFSNSSWAVEDGVSYNMCKHKPLFFPFSWEDFALIWVTFFTIALAAPTGTGGGGILVPMYMIIGEFSAHAAIPLSKATIVGGALANNFINIQRRHPFANRPLVDFDSLQLLVPNLLAGTIFGVFLNAVSPDWLITIGLVLALGYSGLSALKKSWSLYVEEARVSEAETRPLIGGDKAQQRQMPATHYSFDSKDNMPADLYKMVDAESKINFRAIGVVVMAWLVVFICSYLKGGSGNKAMPCGSFGFYAVAFMPVPLILALSWRVGLEVYQRFEQKRSLAYRFADGDPLWTLHNVRLYSFVALFVGMGAGALGIAAGTLLSPLLLAAGMNPMVTVATTGLMVLFTSSATTVQYLILGRLQYDYALFFLGIGIVSAGVGNTLVHYVVRKYKKTWFVVTILALVILLSTVLLGYTGFYRTLRSWLQGENMGFHHICHDSSHMVEQVERDADTSQEAPGKSIFFVNPLDWF